MNKKILITGGTGLVGSRLTELLQLHGYEVNHLGRTKKEGKVNSFVWDIEKGTFDTQSLEGVTTIVHLAGAGVADKRWTDARKEEILQSRIKSTALLFKALKDQVHQVESVISASAIGYYGFGSKEEIFTEESKHASDFLAVVTKQWEDEVDKISSLGLRIVKVRIGIVLSNKGGALVEMMKPIKFGVGSPLASGQQYLSWIHIDDLCALFIKAIDDNQMTGAYNATTDWATNNEFTKILAEVLSKPLWLPHVPAFILKLIVGEMAEMIINGSKVSSEKIKEAGLMPVYSSLKRALVNLLQERLI